MFQPFTRPAALAALLMSLTATAQAVPTGHSPPRSVVLTGKAGEAPVLFLAPGTFTLVVLDEPIVRESVEVEGRARFARVDPGDQSITLALAEPIGPNEQLAIRFTYRGGSPLNAVLLLTGQPGAVDTVVNVRRPLQAVAACQVELAATRERCEAQARELAELKARPLEVSPAEVALSELFSTAGLQRLDFSYSCLTQGDELRPVRCLGLGSKTWSVVVLKVSNLGRKPWIPAWAEVAPITGGEPHRVRVVVPDQAPLPPGSVVSVAIEVEMPSREPAAWLTAPHSLRVCDIDGSRCLSITNIKL